MQLKNKVIVAAAGSGKTTYIVKQALNNAPKKTLIVTYTNKNREEIEKKIIELHGFIPNHIVVKSWYTFLLSDLIRPYQNFVYEERIDGVFFPTGPISRFARKTNIKAYFLNTKNKCFLTRNTCHLFLLLYIFFFPFSVNGFCEIFW